MTTPKTRKTRTRMCDTCGKEETIRADNRSERCRSCATSIQNKRMADIRSAHYNQGKDNPNYKHGEFVGMADRPPNVDGYNKGDQNPNYIHGQSNSRTYRTWQGMMKRCFDTSHKMFSRYGGRGITVCTRWKEFKAFFEDMGERQKLEQLHRINNELGYYPANCVWLDWRVHNELHKKKKERS